MALISQILDDLDVNIGFAGLESPTWKRDYFPGQKGYLEFGREVAHGIRVSRLPVVAQKAGTGGILDHCSCIDLAGGSVLFGHYEFGARPREIIRKPGTRLDDLAPDGRFRIALFYKMLKWITHRFQL